MYQIRRTEYGLHLTFSGHIQPEEIQQWLEDLQAQLPTLSGKFSVFVDMRHMILLPPDSQPAMRDGQNLAKQAGMVRSVVILADEVIALQFRRLAKQSGIIDGERYIDASTIPDWEQAGLDWILKGIDPYPEGGPDPNDSMRLIVTKAYGNKPSD